MTPYKLWLYKKILSKVLTPNIIIRYSKFLEYIKCYDCNKIIINSKGFCNQCKSKLCYICTIRAEQWGIYHRKKKCTMCNNCCWWEIT